MQQHAKSPRKRKLMLYFTYGLMTMAVAVISAVCIFLVLGYRFDFRNGDVEQGALIQFRSFPAGATINFDGEDLSFVTPGKRNVDVGQHTTTMKLDGYLPWQKTVTVKASELRWLNYARLIPEELRTTNAKEFPSLASALPAPDRKWILVQPVADKPDFTLVDIRDTKKPVFTALNIPPSLYAEPQAQGHQFSIVEWDFGARYVLVKHTIGATTEYLRLDRTDIDNTVNISNKLGVNIEDIHFSGTSGTVFFALENGVIRKLDSGAGTLSQPIVKDVASFELFKTDTMAYVKKPIEGKIGVGVVVDNKARRVATYDETAQPHVDLNEYFNDLYLAVGRGTTVEVYKDPETDQARKITTQATPSAVSWTQISNNGRFVVAGTGSQFTTYDLETTEKSDVNLPGTAVDPSKPLQWLDDYYLVSTAGNDLRITEFDGANQHVITASLPGVPVTLNNDGKRLYSFGKTQSGTIALQSTVMTIDK